MSKLWKSLFKDAEFSLMERVEVEWVDASGGSGWMALEEFLAGKVGEVVRSIGYVADYNDQTLRLVHSQGADADISGVCTIPTPLIHRIIKLGHSGDKI